MRIPTGEPEAAPAPAPAAIGRALLTIVRLPGALLYGCAWILASALTLVVCGALAGWRDMRAFTRIEPPGDEDQ